MSPGSRPAGTCRPPTSTNPRSPPWKVRRSAYKGLASYYDIAGARRAAWSYQDAWPEVWRVSGLISFEPDKVDVNLDGARLRLEPGQVVIPHGPDRDLSTDEVAPAGRDDRAGFRERRPAAQRGLAGQPRVTCPLLTFARSGISVPFATEWRSLLDLADAWDAPPGGAAGTTCQGPQPVVDPLVDLAHRRLNSSRLN
jgi:hypothetical protein